MPFQESPAPGSSWATVTKLLNYDGSSFWGTLFQLLLIRIVLIFVILIASSSLPLLAVVAGNKKVLVFSHYRVLFFPSPLSHEALVEELSESSCSSTLTHSLFLVIRQRCCNSSQLLISLSAIPSGI